MKSINLPIELTIPNITIARKFTSPASLLKSKGRISTTYEISFYYEGNGILKINDTINKLKFGSVRFISPGMFLNSKPHYSCYTVNFNFGEANTIYHNQIIDNISPFMQTDGSLKKVFEEIIKREESINPADKIYQKALLMQIISSLYEISVKKHPYSNVINDCIKYLEDNYNRQISLKELANFSGYSDVHLLRLFKKDTSKSPHDFLTEIRIRHAKDILSSTNNTIENIAYECGFKSSSHFKTLFKKFTGLTPGNYRKTTEIIF